MGKISLILPSLSLNLKHENVLKQSITPTVSYLNHLKLYESPIDRKKGPRLAKGQGEVSEVRQLPVTTMGSRHQAQLSPWPVIIMPVTSLAICHRGQSPQSPVATMATLANCHHGQLPPWPVMTMVNCFHRQSPPWPVATMVNIHRG